MPINHLFFLKFGSDNASSNGNSTATNKPLAPVFNFGQSTTLTNNNLNNSKPNLSSTLNNSFSFGESIQNDSNNSLMKPVSANTSAFTFGADLNNKQAANSTLLPTSSKPPPPPPQVANTSAFTFGNLDNNSSNNSMFKAPSSNAPIFTFGKTTTDQQATNKQTSLANFSFGSIDKSKDNLLLANNSLANNQNAGFKFNLNSNLTTNFSSAAATATTNNLNQSIAAAPKPAFNFGNIQTSNQSTSTPYKFDSTQVKPSFNFGNLVATSPQPPPQFGSLTQNDSFASTAPPTFNSTAKPNILFNIGRK